MATQTEAGAAAATKFPLAKMFWIGGVPTILAAAIAVLILMLLAILVITLIESIGRYFGTTEGLLAITLVCVFLSLLLLLAPVSIYVLVGQAKRLDLIKGYYSPDIIVRYFGQFWAGRDGFADLIEKWKKRCPPSSGDDLNKELTTKFNDLLKDDFGLKIYIIPLVLLASVAAIVMYFGFIGGVSLAKSQIETAKNGVVNSFDIPLFGLKMDLVSIAAIFGAYTWITADSITRNYQATFHPSDLLWYALRLIIAVPLGEAISMLAFPTTSDPTKVAAVSPGTWGAFLAFVISMFSLDSIKKYLGNAVNRFTNTQPATPSEREDLVVKLPGVDEETGRRLSAEGVTTIAQVVSVDPIRLTVRSGLTFDFVLSLVDAAILWTYVGGKITCLREFGFKGASNIFVYNDIARNRDILQLANAISEADTNRQTSNERQKGLDSNQAELAAKMQRRDKELSDIDKSMGGAAESDKIDLQRRSNDLTSELAQLEQDLEQAKAKCAEASATSGEAAQKAEQAKADLVDVINKSAILADLAEKAGMKVSGLQNVFQQIARDEYAGFIGLLMGIKSAKRQQ